jgi:hypothetical protein
MQLKGVVEISTWKLVEAYQKMVVRSTSLVDWQSMLA